MSIVDIIILICFIPFLVKGFLNGLIRQIIGIASLILGVWSSYKFSSIVASWITEWVEASGPVINIISFTLIFIVVIAALSILGKVLEGCIRLIMLGWLNKLLGVIFAFIKCALIVGFIILIFNSVNAKLGLVSPQTLSESALYYPLKSMATQIFPYITGYLFN